jgi:excisionase family DNA binding protein
LYNLTKNTKDYYKVLKMEVLRPDVKEVMDIKELSEYLGIGKSKIYSLIRHKKIPASRIGRQYRFSKEIVNNWLKERIITKKEEPTFNLESK